MRKWKHRIRIRHLFTENEDHESIQISMNNIADVLQKSGLFVQFELRRFREIPEGDDYFGPVDYANKLIGEMWDWADCNSIWIEF